MPRRWLLATLPVIAVAAVLLVRAQLVAEAPESKDAELAEKLEALGYAVWSPIGSEGRQVGVVQYDEERASPGVNLYTSVDEAYLVDMAGNRVHAWRQPADAPRGRWAHVEPLADGSIVVIVLDAAVMKLSWHSELEWAVALRAHHDVAVGPDGRIWVIHRADEIVDFDGSDLPVLVDRIAVLSADGRLERDLSLLPALRSHVSPSRLAVLRAWSERSGVLGQLRARVPGGGFVLHMDTPPDLFHTNSIEIVDRDLEGFARAGDLLLSVRELDRIGTLDPDAGSLRWSWGPGVISRQHQPTVLPNGNVLLFDNGPKRGWSRVMEVDPGAGSIVWQYPARPHPGFWSFWGGGSEPLPNGNVLITESAKGRVFEVTRSGVVAWDYYNPRLKEGKDERETIYRCTRLADRSRHPFLERLAARPEQATGSPPSPGARP